MPTMFEKVDFVFDYVVLNLRYSLLQPVSNTDRLAQDFFDSFCLSGCYTFNISEIY